jgi:hypothetical protein
MELNNGSIFSGSSKLNKLLICIWKKTVNFDLHLFWHFNFDISAKTYTYLEASELRADFGFIRFYASNKGGSWYQTSLFSNQFWHVNISVMVPNWVVLGIFNMMQNYLLSLCMQLVSLNYYPLGTYDEFTQYFAFPYAQHFFERKWSIAKLFNLFMRI